MSVHVHCTEGVTGSEEREVTNGVGGGINVGGWKGEGKGVGDGDRAGTGTGLEASEGAQDVNGDGNGDGVETKRERG